MKFIWLTLLACALCFASCSSDEGPLADYPEVAEYIETNDLPDFEKVEVNVDNPEYHYFSGFTDTNDEGLFFNESLKVNTLTETHLKFPDTKMTKAKGMNQYEFFIYEFGDEEELQKLIDFVPSISRMYSHHKEIHEFVVLENKVMLYYFGFP